jgi:hypothetical protein
MAQVGYFMLCWSRLEQALNNEICQLRTELGKGAGTVQGSLQERLDEWTGLVGRFQADTHTHLVAEQLADEVKLLRGHRNLIVHGLLGGNARPNEGAPHISCAEGGYSKPTGEVRLYSLTYLEELTQSVDRCRIGFGMLDRWKPGPIS